jgi:bifunctional enzyme CysN/CysC
MAHISDLIGEDINAYLHSHQHKGLLRFITCGSVDDGMARYCQSPPACRLY